MALLTLHDEDKREGWEAEDAERRWAHYQKCEGTARRHRRAMKPIEDKPEPKPASLADMRRAIEAHSKTLEALKDTARRLPTGTRGKPSTDRLAAIRLCLDSEMRPAEVARLFGVSRARIAQLQATDVIPF